MKLRTPLATAAILATVALSTACATDPGEEYTAQPQTVTQFCGQADANGEVYQVPDAMCEDNAFNVVWFYGGSAPVVRDNRRYVKAASRRLPVGRIIVVRPVSQGGDPRTVGRVHSANTALRNQSASDSGSSNPNVKPPTARVKPPATGGGFSAGGGGRTGTISTRSSSRR